jgi:hypothetical protein
MVIKTQWLSKLLSRELEQIKKFIFFFLFSFFFGDEVAEIVVGGA